MTQLAMQDGALLMCDGALSTECCDEPPGECPVDCDTCVPNPVVEATGVFFRIFTDDLQTDFICGGNMTSECAPVNECFWQGSIHSPNLDCKLGNNTFFFGAQFLTCDSANNAWNINLNFFMSFAGGGIPAHCFATYQAPILATCPTDPALAYSFVGFTDISLPGWNCEVVDPGEVTVHE